MRPDGQPWPGLNTRGGKLDPGQGQLEDGSFGSVINEADLLEKRKGFIRGMDERFDGVVCGLFKYTDECGAEYVIVADQTNISVRTPFDIPTFLGSDSLPNDDFQAAEVNTARWTNTGTYQPFLGSLISNPLSTFVFETILPEDRLMQWFKESVLTSYQVEIQYAIVAGGAGQIVAAAIKRNGSTYLLANIYLTGTTYTLTLLLFQSAVATVLATSELGGAEIADGFLQLAYDAESRVASARAIPTGGAQVTISATLSEAQDNNLGQDSAIGIAVEASDAPEILQVTGGSLGS